MYSRELTSWIECISGEMRKNKDDWENMETSTLTDEEFYAPFEARFGGIQGKPFTLWTRDFVYFPVRSGDYEWCGSVPRNPCDKATEHKGA